jgi:plastocyanin
MRFVLLVATTFAAVVRAGTSDALVDVRTFQFTPDTLRVATGTKVTWTNRDDIEHTVSGGSPDARDAAFSATLSRKGTTAERTFDRPGTFTYFCDRHHFMRGAVTVTR